MVEQANIRTGEQLNDGRYACGLLLNCSPAQILQLALFMAFMFENLEVYQKAVNLADSIAGSTEEFARGYYFLADQLNRAALSIATNIAEGNGRFTKPDRKNFFVIARGSTQECVPLLELARRRNLVSDAKSEQLRNELEIIAKMISGLINGLDNRQY